LRELLNVTETRMLFETESISEAAMNFQRQVKVRIALIVRVNVIEALKTGIKNTTVFKEEFMKKECRKPEKRQCQRSIENLEEPWKEPLEDLLAGVIRHSQFLPQ